MVAADARTAITFALSPGQAHDAQHGRELLGGLGPLPEPLPLLMDGAYEDDQTRQLALDFGWIPVVPPKRTRLEPWEFDRVLYRRRNEVERLFRRLKGFRRIFSPLLLAAAQGGGRPLGLAETFGPGVAGPAGGVAGGEGLYRQDVDTRRFRVPSAVTARTRSSTCAAFRAK